MSIHPKPRLFSNDLLSLSGAIAQTSTALRSVHTWLASQVSKDGQRLCTTSADKSIKFYDVVSFDMSHMIALAYTPTRATWIHERGRKASAPERS